MSTKTRELNRQLFITLTFQVTKELQFRIFIDFFIQTLFPFFMMYCPVGSLISFPFLEIEVGKFGNYTGAAAGIYPALEPLIAIFCIKDFRREVLCKNTLKFIRMTVFVFRSTEKSSN